jgi:hypothetical protein
MSCDLVIQDLAAAAVRHVTSGESWDPHPLRPRPTRSDAIDAAVRFPSAPLGTKRGGWVGTPGARRCRTGARPNQPGAPRSRPLPQGAVLNAG